MDKGKLFLITIVVLITAVFLTGVIYILGRAVRVVGPSVSGKEPRINYYTVTKDNFEVEKQETSERIDYNFEIAR